MKIQASYVSPSVFKSMLKVKKYSDERIQEIMDELVTAFFKPDGTLEYSKKGRRNKLIWTKV